MRSANLLMSLARKQPRQINYKAQGLYQAPLDIFPVMLMTHMTLMCYHTKYRIYLFFLLAQHIQFHVGDVDLAPCVMNICSTEQRLHYFSAKLVQTKI